MRVLAHLAYNLDLESQIEFELAAMNKTIFRKVDFLLRKDSGCNTDIDQLEQVSWMLFLKYMDEQDGIRGGKGFSRVLRKEYQWSTWLSPSKGDGVALKAFIDDQLFPYLKSLKTTGKNMDSLEYKIGEIFAELRNRIHNTSILQESLYLIDQLQFHSGNQGNELSLLYEEKINSMGRTGKAGGEYYTPSPLIRSIVQVIDPKIGETVYDGAVGSAGFLVEAFKHVQQRRKLSLKELSILCNDTLYGKEKKCLAYLIASMNMILHGVEAPNIIHGNTLSDKQEANTYDIVLANPPFGCKEDPSVLKNFPIKTSETSILFLQHFIGILKNGGRAGIILKSSFLDNSEKAFVEMRKQLLVTCDLHSILLLPNGVFPYAKLKTVVLFFEKGKPTRDIWFYQLDNMKPFGRRNAIAESDLSDFVEKAKDKVISENSWLTNISEIDNQTYCLKSTKPSEQSIPKARSPRQIYEEMQRLESKSHKLLESIRKYL